MVSETKSSWRAVTSGVSQGSTLGLVLFNFIKHLEYGTERKFADDTRQGRVYNRPGSCTVMKRIPKKTEKWAESNLIKCQILHLGRNNPLH